MVPGAGEHGGDVLAVLSNPRNRVIAGAAVTTVVVLVLIAAFVGLRGSPQRTVADPLPSALIDSPSPTVSPTPTPQATDSPSPSPTAAPKPTRKKAPPPKPK